MVRIGKLVISLTLLLVALPAWTLDGVNVTSMVDRNEMGEGDTFTLSIRISSESSVNMAEPQLPSLENFDLLNTWQGSESRSSFVNGTFQVERTTTYNYMLAPKKQGQFEIGAARVSINGQTFSTKPIKVRVVAGQAAPSPQPKNRRVDPFGDEIEDLFSQFLQRRPRPGFRSQPVDPKEAFFIQVDVDKTEVFAGEQVVATWFLYTRGQISDIDTLSYPSLNGFWKEDVEVATRLNFNSEIVNGLPYRKALLASYALFPINPGEAKIDPYKARCTVIAPSTFGFGRPYKYTKQSKEVVVKVKPIPTQGRPDDFAGAVGMFNVSSTLDSQSVPVNQPVTLKIRFSGRGNAKLIDLPKIELPEGLELYDTKKEAKFLRTGNSYKEFELLIIPRKAGEMTISGISVSLFDPENAQFYRRTTEPVSFTVVPGEGEEQIPAIPMQAELSPQETGPQLPGLILKWESGHESLSGLQVASIWGMAYVLGLIWVIWRGFKELGIGQRRKDVNLLFKNRFKVVHQKLADGDWRAVGVEVMNTVYFLLGEISGQGGANLELEKLLLKAPPSVRRELGEDLLKELKKFEALSFAPEKVVGDLKDSRKLKDSVARIEKILEKAISLGLGAQMEGTSH